MSKKRSRKTKTPLSIIYDGVLRVAFLSFLLGAALGSIVLMPGARSAGLVGTVMAVLVLFYVVIVQSKKQSELILDKLRDKLCGEEGDE